MSKAHNNSAQTLFGIVRAGIQQASQKSAKDLFLWILWDMQLGTSVGN